MNPILDTLLHAWRAFSTLAVRIGRGLATWAAAQSWGRLVVLSLLALIAQSIISDSVLHWQDERTVRHPPAHRHAHGADGTEDSNDPDVHIGWDGINVIHRPPAAKVAGQTPDPAAGPAAAATGAATDAAKADTAGAGNPPAGSSVGTPAPPDARVNLEVKLDGGDDTEDVQVHRTFTGWLHDALEGLVLLLIVYLIAAKIVMRQAARSEARAVEAEASAAAAEADAERSALRYQLAQAQLQTLQAQVEPHFLFNTLASVDFLIETDPARASAMQKNLIRYLRAALPQMRDPSSQLGRETELVRAYLEILKVRMEERLQVVIDVPEGLRSAEFPPMLLQSLVENAIRHGLEPKAAGGEICIQARVEDGALLVQVRDTGVGLTASGAGSGRPEGASGGDAPGINGDAPVGGVGLRNAAERLALLYPGAASCTLQANTPCGAVASIRLPYRVASPRAAGGAAA